MKNMKTFKDLEFKPHPVGNGLMSRIYFNNGYGCSVVRFTMDDVEDMTSNIISSIASGMKGETNVGSYTHGDEWELAIIKGDKENSELCYDTEITNDVIGHLTDKGVTRIMKQIQRLK